MQYFRFGCGLYPRIFVTLLPAPRVMYFNILGARQALVKFMSVECWKSNIFDGDAVFSAICGPSLSFDEVLSPTQTA